jgi:glycosyltransferase involved in cell wall biosynthesis
VNQILKEDNREKVILKVPGCTVLGKSQVKQLLQGLSLVFDQKHQWLTLTNHDSFATESNSRHEESVSIIHGQAVLHHFLVLFPPTLLPLRYPPTMDQLVITPKTRFPNRIFAKVKLMWQSKRTRSEVPLVSVIVPFYNINSTEWFTEMLESLWNQSFQDFEVIIVDDGSQKQACGACEFLYEELNKQYQLLAMTKAFLPSVEVLKLARNGGLAVSRNVGALRSKSPFIFFLDPDDKLDALALEKLVLVGLQRLGKPVPHYTSKYYGFVYSGVVHFGHVREVVYSEYSATKLTQENYLTSAALIHRGFYIEVGGMCPRTTISYYEDWDFWLRFASLGYVGVHVRDALFYYRRHHLGQSTQLQTALSKEQAAKEARLHNPVIYGDMSYSDLQLLINSRRVKESAINTLPCYMEMDWSWHPDFPLVDIATANHSVLFAAWILSVKTSQRGIPSFSTSIPLSPTPRLACRVLYAIPWAVTGGADLFDQHVLQVLHEHKRCHITLVLARDIKHQAWLPRFQKVVDEVFHLPVLAKSDQEMRRIMDYLFHSRQPTVFVNRGTVLGYEVIEQMDQSHGRSTKFVDILHLYRLDDRTDWEWRAGRVTHLIDKRIVVSHDLKRYMNSTVKYGDMELGIRDAEHKARHFSGEDDKKMRVIYPAVDFNGVNLALNHDNTTAGPLTMLFIGRAEEQKDPHLFVDVCWEVFRTVLNENENQHLLPQLKVIGTGSLLHQMYQRAEELDSQINSSNSFVKQFEWLGQLDHEHVLRFITSKTRPVLVVTSRYEGVPIVILESLAVGIPVVTTNCGGISEVLLDPILDIQSIPRALIHRPFCDTALSLNTSETDILHEQDLHQRNSTLHALTTSVLSIWRQYRNNFIPSPLVRWQLAQPFRTKYGLDRFNREILDIFDSL